MAAAAAAATGPISTLQQLCVDVLKPEAKVDRAKLRRSAERELSSIIATDAAAVKAGVVDLFPSLVALAGASTYDTAVVKLSTLFIESFAPGKLALDDSVLLKMDAAILAMVRVLHRPEKYVHGNNSGGELLHIRSVAAAVLAQWMGYLVPREASLTVEGNWRKWLSEFDEALVGTIATWLQEAAVRQEFHRSKGVSEELRSTNAQLRLHLFKLIAVLAYNPCGRAVNASQWLSSVTAAAHRIGEPHYTSEDALVCAGALKMLTELRASGVIPLGSWVQLVMEIVAAAYPNGMNGAHVMAASRMEERRQIWEQAGKEAAKNAKAAAASAGGAEAIRVPFTANDGLPLYCADVLLAAQQLVMAGLTAEVRLDPSDEARLTDALLCLYSVSCSNAQEDGADPLLPVKSARVVFARFHDAHDGSIYVHMYENHCIRSKYAVTVLEMLLRGLLKAVVLGSQQPSGPAFGDALRYADALCEALVWLLDAALEGCGTLSNRCSPENSLDSVLRSALDGAQHAMDVCVLGGSGGGQGAYGPPLSDSAVTLTLRFVQCQTLYLLLLFVSEVLMRVGVNDEESWFYGIREHLYEMAEHIEANLRVCWVQHGALVEPKLDELASFFAPYSAKIMGMLPHSSRKLASSGCRGLYKTFCDEIVLL